MTEYYDYVLALIPVTLVGVTVGLGAFGVDPMAAMPVGAAAASLVAGHALFVNGPTDAADSPPNATPRASRSTTSNRPVNAD